MLRASVPFLCAMLLTCATGAAAVQAQTTPTLSDQQIQAALAKLDPNVRSTPVKDSKGQVIATRFFFFQERNGLRYEISMTCQQTVIWMETPLVNIDSEQRIPADFMAKLLKAQIATGPTFFQLRPNGSKLQLAIAHRIDRNVTVERLYQAINEYMGDIDNTRSLWSSYKN